MSKLFAIAIPVLPGKEEQVQKFMNDLITSQSENFKKSRKDLGVRERSFLQKTPDGGAVVIVTLEGEDPVGAFTKFAQSEDEFTKWFAEQVEEIHGFDLKAPPPGPLPELIVDSEA